MARKSTKLTLWEAPGLATRVTAQPATSKALQQIEKKGEPIFAQGSGLQSFGPGGRVLNVNFGGTAIDYAADVGPLWNSSLVMAVVNFCATLFTEPPPQVLEQVKKNLEPVPDHPLPALLNNPNPYDTGDAMMLAFSLDWFIFGNVYWLKERDPKNYHQVVRLWPLPAFAVTPRWDRNDKASFISTYRYTVSGQWVDYLPEDIIHFKRGKDPNNARLGLGAFQPVLREIYGDNMAANFSAVVLKNWGVLPYVISPKKGVNVDDNNDPFEGLTPEQAKAKAEAIKQSFVDNTTGDKRGLPVVQTIPLDITKLGFNPSELDITQLRRVPESRVASVTGIPANILQFIVGLENTNQRASYADSMQQAYTHVIKPILKVVANTIQNVLIPEFGSPKGAKQIFQFDFTQVSALQDDRDKVYRRGTEALRSGGMTLNTFLQSTGKELVEGGDIFYIPKAYLPMTTETLLAVAKDPTLLLAQAPPAFAPANPGVIPSDAPNKSARHLGSGNGFHRNGNGHRPPPRQIEAVKAVEYDGMTLWREPTPLEQTINLKAIQDAFDSGEKKIEQELLDMREKLIAAAVAGIIILSPSDYHTLTLDAPGKSVEQLRKEIQVIYDHGRQLVVDELEAQGATGLGGAGTAGAADTELLDTLAGLSVSRLINDVQARVSGAAVALATLGVSGSDLETQLQEDIDAGSTGYVTTNALSVDHVALGTGRIGEMNDQDGIREFIESCVLDKASCDPCIADDGITSSNIEDLPGEPNPHCEAPGGLCRCVVIAVYDEEAKGARRRRRNRRARSMASAQAGPLTVQEQTSLVGYQSDGYRINKALRDPDAEVPECELLDSALAKSAIADSIVVYHGIGEVLPRNLELLQTIGAEISDAGYLSCSLSLNKARLQSTTGQETVLAITLPKGAPGYQGDDELILERELALRVVGSSKDGNTNIIKMIAVKYSDDQARDDHGRWSAEGGGAGTMNSLADRLSQPDGGFTVQPVTGNEPSGAGNYAVSVSKGQEKVISLSDFNKSPVNTLAEYVKANKALFKDKANHFGAWHDPESHNLFLDVSRVVKSASEAEKLGREYDQLAYYDMGAGKSVSISPKKHGQVHGVSVTTPSHKPALVLFSNRCQRMSPYI